MLKGKTLEKYSDLIIKIGVNLQKGQGLEISCPVEKSTFALALTKAAYKAGASIVRVRWQNEEIDKLSYKYADINALTDIPKWLVDSKNYLVEKGFCYVAVSADDPEAFKSVPSDRLFAVSKAKAKALKKFSDNMMANAIRWCVVSVPTQKWAKKVFPLEKNPVEALSKQIELSMRLNEDNPVDAWNKHIEKLNKRAKFLNDMNFEYLHFSNQKGTSLNVGLADNHIWQCALETAKDGMLFMANMPTEEVFTAPHRERVDGVLKSAMPLCSNGQVIDEFSITFKNGKIVDFSAKKGFDALKQLINTDKGTKRLGEVALIGKNSPIAQSKVLFYNTLFDENASCHLAIGKAYPTTIKGGDKLSIKELEKLGANDSSEHEDFMIGTPDLNVVGIKKDGTTVKIFENGEWVI